MWFPCWKWKKRQTFGPQAWWVFTSLFSFPRSLYHYSQVLFSQHHLFTLPDSLALSGFLNLPIIILYLPFSVLALSFSSYLMGSLQNWLCGEVGGNKRHAVVRRSDSVVHPLISSVWQRFLMRILRRVLSLVFVFWLTSYRFSQHFVLLYLSILH